MAGYAVANPPHDHTRYAATSIIGHGNLPLLVDDYRRLHEAEPLARSTRAQSWQDWHYAIKVVLFFIFGNRVVDEFFSSLKAIGGNIWPILRIANRLGEFY